MIFYCPTDQHNTYGRKRCPFKFCLFYGLQGTEWMQITNGPVSIHLHLPIPGTLSSLSPLFSDTTVWNLYLFYVFSASKISETSTSKNHVIEILGESFKIKDSIVILIWLGIQNCRIDEVRHKNFIKCNVDVVSQI